MSAQLAFAIVAPSRRISLECPLIDPSALIDKVMTIRLRTISIMTGKQMRYGWEIVGLTVLGALAYSLIPETTYAKCDLMSEGGEISEHFFELKSIKYPWTVFLGHDAILTGGATPIPSYIELASISGVGYIQADDKGPSINLFRLSGVAFLKIQGETFEGNCHQIEAVFP